MYLLIKSINHPKNCGVCRIIPRDFASSTREFAFHKLHKVKNLAWPLTYTRDGAVKSHDFAGFLILVFDFSYTTPHINLMKFLFALIGEDRWLCTLMVQAGWRLEYCAAAENSTYCPDSFDEFYKQRRRWIPSTLANLALLISESDITVKNNDAMSFMFILYQAATVFSTLVR